MIIRGICCMFTENKHFKEPVQAISIIDEYLEHARVMIFENGGHRKVFISSADWMLRNIDHRIEVSCPILDKGIKKELIDIINIELHDNIKARILDNELSNQYVNPRNTKKIRSQIETFNYLSGISVTPKEEAQANSLQSQPVPASRNLPRPGEQ